MDDSINRDVNNVVSTETKDLGGANIDIVVDVEYIDKDGFKALKEDLVEIGDAVGTVVGEVRVGVETVKDTILDREIGDEALEDRNTAIRKNPFGDPGVDHSGGAGDEFAWILQEEYNKKMGRNMEEDWEYIPLLPGDAVQLVPGPVYGTIGVIAGIGSIVLTGGAATPFVITGIGSSGLSVFKSYLDYKEGHVTRGDATTSGVLSTASNIPYIGVPIGVGSIIYDSVPRNNDENN